MKSRITPHFKDLVYDAALKSFWRKKALRAFLLDCGVSGTFLSTWASDESKREFLDRLFGHLTRAKKGGQCLVRMAKYLVDQESFPDLLNWEDSKVKVAEASEAVGCLRSYIEKQEQEIESEEQVRKSRAESRMRQQQHLRSQQDLERLSSRLTGLASRMGTQQAGYEFQDWFYDLLDYCELQNRRPYVHNGRQVDGSVTLAGTTYLVELKFTTGQAQAPDVDVFRRKVTSKADNTMGIMVSVSSYTSVAIEAAAGERTPLLLMDHAHLYLVLSGGMGMDEVIERIRRHSSQTGEPYLAADRFSE